MHWTAVSIILSIVLFGLWLARLIIDRAEQPHPKSKRAVNVAIAFAAVSTVISMVQVVTQSRLEKLIVEFLKGQRSKHNIEDTTNTLPEMGLYKGGIPQSSNDTLRILFKKGTECLQDSTYEEALVILAQALKLQGIQPTETAAIWLHMGIAHHGRREWQLAEAQYLKVRKWAKKGGYQYAEGVAIRNLGLLYSSLSVRKIHDQ